MKPIRKSVALVLAVLVMSVASRRESCAQSVAAQIDAVISEYAANGDFHGTALVAGNGEVLFKKGYGWANYEWDIPNMPDTKFRLGSITKQFTSMLIMQLVQEGKLKLDGKISDYLPDYPKDEGSRVSVHHLLTHTSGIPSYTGMRMFGEIARDPYPPREFIKFFADSAFEFEPGSQYRYNNSGYFLLGVIIEEVTGKPYATVLQERIFGPLGMTSSGYDMPGPIIPKRAAGYEWGIDGFVNAEYLDMTLPYAAGSLYSTVEDLYRWDRALYTEKLLPARFRDRLFEPAIQTPGGGSYAYGWGVRYRRFGSMKDSVIVISHGGGINGFNTLMERVPKEELLIVLLNNTGRAPLGAISEAILVLLHNGQPAPVRQSLARALTKEIKSNGLSSAPERYAVMKKDTATYILNENEMNLLGYQYLRAGRQAEAIAVFKLNVEAFPASSNVYDSLGEAYMKAGQKELAITNYEKSIELDPGNTNGIRMLNILRGK
jgi:CubicO group peptidase (beta-lactamase class C family)